MKDCFCGCGRRIPRFPLDLRALNERGRHMSERLAWALDVGVAPTPVASQEKGKSVVEAGADRAGWAKDGFALIAELRDAMHGVIDPDSLPETPSERWEAEGQYLESLAVTKRQLPSLGAWLDDHPDAGCELARHAPEPAEARE